MKDKERLSRLHKMLNAAEAEAVKLEADIQNTVDKARAQELEGELNHVRARLNALQTRFNSEFEPPDAPLGS